MLDPSLSEPLRSTIRLAGEPVDTSVSCRLDSNARNTAEAITASAITAIVSEVRRSRARTFRTL